uniref:glycosyl hydrolase n=1 Tax=uncultured Draconibacterium sp. TaxID=1573823 RepID=UPI003216A70F
MKMVKTLSILFWGVLLFVQCSFTDKKQQNDYTKIQSDFINPTEDNTLWCYWYWIGDDISKEGITKDLEAMKSAGIGAAFIGNINPEEKDGKVPMLSEDWWEHMVHAVNEGKRIGVDIGSFNCPGWSMSGGPWITYDKAMRHLVYSETFVIGGRKVEIQLEQPKGEFQDVYVLAFPKNSQEDRFLNNSNAIVTLNPSVKNPQVLLDGDMNTGVSFISPEYTIEINSNHAITARSITLLPVKNNLIVDCELQAFVDGIYVTVKEFNFDRRDFMGQVGPIPYGPLKISLPGVKSDNFRLICRNINASEASGFSEIVISEEAVVEEFLGKTLGRMHPTPQPSWNSYSWKSVEEFSDPKLAVTKEEVLDISNKMDKNGKLNWEAPEGEWIVMRLGMTPTGTKNSPSAPQGKGYEVDKANRELVRFHFEQFIGEFLQRIPEESKSAFKYVIADSYETGSQNWTDGFERSFEERYGYNPKKYLPVFSGRIVGSVDESDRFLWDLRRAVADDVAYRYTGGLREIANGNDLKLWLENYGHWGYPSEFLMYGGQSDFVSGEYWNEGTLGDIECKAASSAAHIYGKKRTSAECFTASQRTYVRHPAKLKKRGDWSLTEGINHHVLHLYIHQPDDEKVPGTNAWFSTEFNRHNTWFRQGKTYFDYLRRAQHMLQQGNYVADVCYFIGEDAPIMTGATNPELPKGYSFDYINAEVIMDRMAVVDGKFVLPDGMSYRMMVLPPLETMRPETLAKMEKLVAEGGIIYGQAPKTSPSLQNYPQCDEQVQALASKVWSGNNKVKSYGKGAVVDGLPLQEALDHFDIEKDVDVSDEVLWTHRSMSDMDVYFLTNQSGKAITINPSFRIDGLKPQLWDAVTGEIRALNDYKVVNGRTIVPLEMETDRSWVVVFTNESNELVNAGFKVNSPEYKTVQTIGGEWKIDFENKRIAPAINTTNLMDWIESDDELLKYYSGTANYSTTFSYSNAEAKNVFIDLGEVGVMATVTLNGQEVGTTWMAPYRLNITEALKEGENTLEVKVVNVWRNRLTGDKTLPEEERTTSVWIDNITSEEELIPSGLIGPVTIQVVE